MSNLRLQQILWAFILGMLIDNVIRGEMLPTIIFIVNAIVLLLSFFWTDDEFDGKRDDVID